MDLKISEPLVSVDWLIKKSNHAQLVILDASIPKVGATQQTKSQKLIIPNARHLDLKGKIKDLDSPLPNTLPAPEYFESQIRELGINEDSCIVCYDEKGVYSSPRAWWLFKTMGHDNVAVLNGGLPAWIDAGHQITSEYKEPLAKGNFNSHFNPLNVKYTTDVLNNISSNSCKVIDARSEGRFNGTEPEPRAGLRGGHIPNSKSLPFTNLLENGFFLEKEDLKTKFDAILNEEESPIFTCGSGITACILALGAEIAGIKNISVYDGSWTEWALDERLPVSKAN